MIAPRCKICGHEHWAGEPHVLPKPAPKKVRNRDRRAYRRNYYDRKERDKLGHRKRPASERKRRPGDQEQVVPKSTR